MLSRLITVVKKVAARLRTLLAGDSPAPAKPGGTAVTPHNRTMPDPAAVAVGPAHIQTEPTATPAQAIKQGQGTFRQIALTFDTEFTAENTPRLLDVLDANLAKSTFFLVGQEVSQFNTLTHRIAATHEIGNHTYHHVEMPKITPSQMANEIKNADMAISAEAGRTPKPFFRPPFGSYDDTVLQVCGEQGYPYLIHWSVAPDETSTVEQEVSDILTQAFPGGIALFHGWTTPTPPALEQALPELRRRGYQFVTVSEILGFGRDVRDWGGTPIHVQDGDTLAYLGLAYNTPSGFLTAYNELDGDPTPGMILMTPHKDEIIVRVNGARLDFDVYPRIVSDRTIAPVRQICEFVGGAVTWVPSSRQIIVDRKDKHIIFTLDSSSAVVNGVPTAMPLPAQLISGRTLVPLRFLVEVLGFSVGWDGTTRTVAITAVD